MTSVHRRRLTRVRQRIRTNPRPPLLWGFLATLGGGAAFLILSAAATLSTVFVYLGLALFLSLSLEPVIRWATRHGIPRGAAVLGCVLTLMSVTAGLLTIVLPQVITQFGAFVSAAPDLARQVLELPLVRDMNVDLEKILGEVVTFVSDPVHLASFGGGLLSVGRGIANTVSGASAVMILTLYFALTFPTMTRSLARAVPASRRQRVTSLADEVFMSVGRYVAGQVALAALNAVIVFIVMTIAQGPAPSLLAVLAFVGALIPVVGTVAAYIIIILSMLLTTSPIATIVVAAILVTYAQVEAYLLTPRVMSRAVSIPGSLVVIAAFAGAALGGVLGALVAVPVIAAGVIIFERVVVPLQQAR